MSSERSKAAILTDHTPRCPCSWYVIQLHDRIVHVLEEFMLQAGAAKGRDLRLGVRRLRSGASQDRHGDVVWLDFRALGARRRRSGGGPGGGCVRRPVGIPSPPLGGRWKPRSRATPGTVGG
jgi:hypothetical protein